MGAESPAARWHQGRAARRAHGRGCRSRGDARSGPHRRRARRAGERRHRHLWRRDRSGATRVTASQRSRPSSGASEQVSRKHLTAWSYTEARPCTAPGSIPTVTIASPWPLPPSARSCRASSSRTRAVLRRPIPAFSTTWCASASGSAESSGEKAASQGRYVLGDDVLQQLQDL